MDEAEVCKTSYESSILSLVSMEREINHLLTECELRGEVSFSNAHHLFEIKVAHRRFRNDLDQLMAVAGYDVKGKAELIGPFTLYRDNKPVVIYSDLKGCILHGLILRDEHN